MGLILFAAHYNPVNTLSTSVIGYKLVRVSRENKKLREKLGNKGNKSLELGDYREALTTRS